MKGATEIALSSGPCVKTHGLTHIALAVKDPERSLAFYRRCSVSCRLRQADFIQAQTPGSRDVLVFERGKRAGKAGGVAHFGFRLTKPADLPKALDAIKAAGGKITSHGEFCPGEPYVFFLDPDGYEVEIWYKDSDDARPEARSPAGYAWYILGTLTT